MNKQHGNSMITGMAFGLVIGTALNVIGMSMLSPAQKRMLRNKSIRAARTMGNVVGTVGNILK